MLAFAIETAHRKAVLLAQLLRREECIEACILSIASFPWNWATWELLASCVGDSEEVSIPQIQFV